MKKAVSEDPRRAPFVEFIFKRRPDLQATTHVSAFKELKDCLSKTKGRDGFSLEDLKAYWIRFEESTDEFHRRQGQPLRYFCTNLPAFMNGNGRPKHTEGDLEQKRQELAAMGVEI